MDSMNKKKTIKILVFALLECFGNDKISSAGLALYLHLFWISLPTLGMWFNVPNSSLMDQLSDIVKNS